MKKPKHRRKLLLSDYRKHARVLFSQDIILCGGEGYIDVRKIEEVFPKTTDQLNYLDALIEGMS